MRFWTKAILFFLMITATASAQQWVGVRAGMINYGGGVFYLDQEKLQFPAARFREIESKTLRTGDGWVELQLGPNAFLWMGGESALRMEDTSLDSIRLRVERGSVIVQVFGETGKNKLTVLCRDAVIDLGRMGVYRLDSEASRLSVYSGKAKIEKAGKKASVKEGRVADLAGGLKTSKFDRAKTDLLHDQAAARSLLLQRAMMQAMAVRRQQLYTATDAASAAYQNKSEQQRRQEIDNQQQINEHHRNPLNQVQPGAQEGHALPPALQYPGLEGRSYPPPPTP